jgi:NitT/TauT family transport system substrate-binding protein
LVLRKGEEISSPLELAGLRLGTPQLGNTQDIALRYFLREHGLKTSEEGGKIQLYPAGNSNLILLFRRGEINGAWTVEPWVSRLVVQEGGYIFLDEDDLWPDGLYPTTYLVGSVTFLKNHPELAAKWVGVHLRLTRELTAEPERFIPEINKELAKVLGQPLPPEVLEPAIGRLRFTCLPMTGPFLAIAEKAHAVGFLPQVPPDLGGIFDLSFLEAAAGGDYSKIP